MICYPMHERELGILGSSMLSPRAKDEMIRIAPSQSSLSVSRDGWSSAPPMFRTTVRPACKMLGLPLGISMTVSTMAPLAWQETADMRNAQGIQCEQPGRSAAHALLTPIASPALTTSHSGHFLPDQWYHCCIPHRQSLPYP